MTPATKRKHPQNTEDSKDGPYAKHTKKQRTPAPKKRGPYRFTFAYCKCKTIEEAYEAGCSFMVEDIVAKDDLLRKHPALVTALRTLPQEFMNDHYTLMTLMDQLGRSVLEHEEEIERGTIKMKDRSISDKFWEAIDSKAVLNAHENAPKLRLEDCGDVLKEPKVYDGESPMHIAFTATVIRISRFEVDEFKVLPCGWPWEAAIQKSIGLVLNGQECGWHNDIRDMVYRTCRFSETLGLKASLNGWSGNFDRLHDPEPVEPRQGCCFRIVGRVTRVNGQEVEVHVAQEPTRVMEMQGLKSWEKDITVHLVEGVEKPETGKLYVFKGLLEPFTDFNNMKFMAEVCDKIEEEVEKTS
jgi:hypothetical protein